MTRGERNNNPLNIRRTRSRWIGMSEAQSDPSFCQFRTIIYGFRAAFILLMNYYVKHRCITLRQIISRWAVAVDIGDVHRTMAVLCQRDAVAPSCRL